MNREQNNIIAYEDFSTKRIFAIWTSLSDESINKLSIEQTRDIVDNRGRMEYYSITDFQTNSPHRSGSNWSYLKMLNGTQQVYRTPLETVIIGIPPQPQPE